MLGGWGARAMAPRTCQRAVDSPYGWLKWLPHSTSCPFNLKTDSEMVVKLFALVGFMAVPTLTTSLQE